MNTEEEKGKIKKTGKHQKSRRTIAGVIAITRRGTGYVKSSLYEQDIEIGRESLNTALNGDFVEIMIVKKNDKGRLVGEVTTIAERSRETFVGVIEHERGLCFVVPDDKRMYTDILIPEEKAQHIETGTKVRVKLTLWDDPKKAPEGEILEILGPKGDNNVEMSAIVFEHGFQIVFPEAVGAEARVLKEQKPFAVAEINQRKDFRGIVTFTIDPHDAKDFDDALSFQKLPDGDLEIGIHIADVSHYIQPASIIDKEAQSRGTSIYLVDRTIPMLPEVLSNDLCSLKPNTDRLAFSAVFVFTKVGVIKSRWFGKSVIHSNKRFNYGEAQTILNAKKGVLYEELKILNDLAKKLKKERLKSGAIEFDQEEIYFELDKSGKPLKIIKKVRQDTNKLIEEFMLLANREVAEYIYRLCKKNDKNIAFVYRVHDVPDPEKVEELAIFLKALGHDLNTKEGIVSAYDINELFKKIEGTAEEQLIKTATIRSMAKAVYATKNIGHFGLAFKYYTHFTSPIRRYPDIMVHRILKKHLHEEPISDQEFTAYEKLAIQSSEREIEAVKAERDSIKYKQVEYMKDHIGETFEGIISGVTDWGIYVEENETKAEGLIRISNLGDDFYMFYKKKYALIGERTKKKFTLGNKVKIKLTGADLDSKTLDFTIV